MRDEVEETSLTFVQRLNLVAMIGAMPISAGVDSVARLRAFWSLCDRIKLTDEELKKIGFCESLKEDGQIETRWNPQAQLPVQVYQFNEADCLLVRQAITAMLMRAGCVVGSQQWLQPLLGVFPPLPVEEKKPLTGGRSGSAA